MCTAQMLTFSGERNPYLVPFIFTDKQPRSNKFVFPLNSVLFMPLPRHFGFEHINDGGNYIIRISDIANGQVLCGLVKYKHFCNTQQLHTRPTAVIDAVNIRSLCQE